MIRDTGTAAATAPPDPPVDVIPSPASPALHRFATVLAGMTLFLVTAGAAVTSTGSGLAVPDWPLSFGTLFPPMVGGVFFEHGHRMIAGVVLIMTVALVIWIHRCESRRWVRRLALGALAAVLAQAALGGITVLFKLPTPVSVSHAGLAMAFLCTIVTLATVTSPAWWRQPRRPVDPTRLQSLRRAAAVTTGVIYAQILLGAVMRHSGAGMAIPDFPLAYGRLFPPIHSAPVLINYAHRLGALVVVSCLVALVVRVLKHHRSDRVLAAPAFALVLAVTIQILLGAVTVWSVRAAVPTTAHVAFGAVVLAASLVVLLRSFHAVPLAAAAGLVGTAAPAESGQRRRVGLSAGGGVAWNPQESGLMMATDGAVATLGKTTDLPRLRALTDYMEITKPRITFMIVMTTAAGYLFGTSGGLDLGLFFCALAGTALIVSSANAFNQVLERDVDAAMRRTRNRPLASGRMEPREGMTAGLVMAAVGLALFVLGVNMLSALLAVGAWANYLFVYTPLKRRTPRCTEVGAVSGAAPPVIGWVAVHGSLALESLVLFAILYFWQLPHFLAIATLYRDDYARAGFPMTPVRDPSGTQAGREIVGYTLLFAVAAVAPFFLGMAGTAYLAGALALALGFVAVGARAARTRSRSSARQLLLVSLIVIPAVLVLLVLDRAGG